MAKRFVIIGSSSSGKTTFAKKLASKLNIAHKELDEMNWGPSWTERTDSEFFRELREFIDQDSWIICGNYSKAREELWKKAEVIIWLNFPLSLVLRQFFYRSLKRSLTKEILWNGNRETIRNSIFSRDSLLIWILQNFNQYKRNYIKLIEENPYHNEFIILKNHREAEKLLENIE